MKIKYFFRRTIYRVSLCFLGETDTIHAWPQVQQSLQMPNDASYYMSSYSPRLILVFCVVSPRPGGHDGPSTQLWGNERLCFIRWVGRWPSPGAAWSHPDVDICLRWSCVSQLKCLWQGFHAMSERLLSVMVSHLPYTIQYAAWALNLEESL